jgi:hypothetical protein
VAILWLIPGMLMFGIVSGATTRGGGAAVHDGAQVGWSTRTLQTRCGPALQSS